MIDFNRGRSAIASQSGGAAEAYVDTAQYQAVAGADTPYTRVYVGGKFSSGVFTAGVECSLAGPGSFGEPLPDGTASTTVSRALPAIFAVNSTVGLEF